MFRMLVCDVDGEDRGSDSSSDFTVAIVTCAREMVSITVLIGWVGLERREGEDGATFAPDHLVCSGFHRWGWKGMNSVQCVSGPS